MSFFGGNAATSTPAKPGGLFPTSGFGAPPTSTAPSLFGNTSGFNAGAFSTPANTSIQPSTGFGGFGAASTATSSAPTLGGFGTFGTNTAVSSAPNLFGTTTSIPSTGFGGFGAGTGTSATPAFGGFGATVSSAAPAGGFGAFSGTSITSTAPTFSGFGTQTSGFSGFGSSGGFGTGFAKPAAITSTPGFGGFTGSTNFMLGQPQQQQQAPQMSREAIYSHSIFNVNIFGDERDVIIAKWNYLQATWGTGKSFYSQNAPPVEITPDSYLCRFKAISYARLPGKENKMGEVGLNFNKSLADVKSQKHQILTALNNLLGNKPNLTLNVETIKELKDNKCQMIIYVEEKNQMPTIETKRILATELATYLNQANMKMQLNNIGVTEILAMTLPDEDQLKKYIENPPDGIDPRIWGQANSDNPDPTKFIPYPMVGFSALKARLRSQEQEVETHALYLRKVEKDLAELRQKHTAATAQIMEHKRKIAELGHRILKIIVKQECTRKLGLALSPEEEALRTKLENMLALVSAPTQFKGRLSELLSQMRMQRNQYATSGASEYIIDKDREDEMKSYLSMQQKAMEVLTETVKKDLKALQIIIEQIPELTRS